MAEMESSIISPDYEHSSKSKLQRVFVAVSAATEESDQHTLQSITLHDRYR